MDFAGHLWSLVELTPVESVGVGRHAYLRNEQARSFCWRKGTRLAENKMKKNITVHPETIFLVQFYAFYYLSLFWNCWNTQYIRWMRGCPSMWCPLCLLVEWNLAPSGRHSWCLVPRGGPSSFRQRDRPLRKPKLPSLCRPEGEVVVKGRAIQVRISENLLTKFPTSYYGNFFPETLQYNLVTHFIIWL